MSSDMLFKTTAFILSYCGASFLLLLDHSSEARVRVPHHVDQRASDTEHKREQHEHYNLNFNRRYASIFVEVFLELILGNTPMVGHQRLKPV